MTEIFTVIAVCCREWPVVPWMRIGKCGICGTVPVIQQPLDETD